MQAEIVACLQRELTLTMRATEVRGKLAGEGAEPMASTPEFFGTFIKSEITQWVKVVREARISAE